MVASSGKAKSASRFSEEQVGSQSYLNRHNTEMFTEGKSFSGNERDKLFLNRGDGTFADVSDLSGCDSPNDGRAVLANDFDGDGDVDLFVGNGGLYVDQREPNRLFLARPTCKPGFVRVRLEDTGSANRFGVGARIRLSDAAGDAATWQHWDVVQAGSGFNSSVGFTRMIGTNGHTGPFHLEVHWPDGRVTEQDGVELGEELVVTP